MRAWSVTPFTAFRKIRRFLGTVVNRKGRISLASDPAYRRASRLVHGSPGKDDDGTSPVRDAEPRPAGFELVQNYPNPFNPETVISYVLPGRERVSLKVYDAHGREIRTLVDRMQTAGSHQILWDSRDDAGRKAPSGLYICRIRAGSLTRFMKMPLMR